MVRQGGSWTNKTSKSLSYEELKSRVSNWLYSDISDTTDLKSRVSNWGLQVKTYRLIYTTDETCEGIKQEAAV